MPDLTLLGLRVVVEVARHGSFTTAAQALGYTQSAISRQVGATEASIGTPLFERHARGVSLTPAGEAFVRHAERALGDVESARQEVAGLRDQLVGRLTVGAFPTAAASLVPRAIARMSATHPGLELELSEAGSPTLVRRVRAGRLAVAVIATGHDLPDHDLEGLDVDLVAVHRGLGVAVSSGHPLAHRRSVRVDELADATWIVGAGGEQDPQFGPWPTLDHPRVGLRASSWPARLGLVAAGLGISVLPGLAADIVPRGVRWLRVVDPGLTQPRQVAIVTRHPRGRSAAALAGVLDEELERFRVDPDQDVRPT